MEEAPNLNSVVSLGSWLWYLQNPGSASAKGYLKGVQDFCDLLGRIGLTNTLNAAESLKRIESLPTIEPKGLVHPLAVGELKGNITPIAALLESEARDKRFVILQTGRVSKKLRQFYGEAGLTDTQKHLAEETIRCLEVGAYRSAAVMGWNFAYDYIRWWMFNDAKRLADFNATLQVKMDRKKNQPLYPKGINSYEDFYNIDPPLGERTVLETMRDASLLPKVYEPLSGYLRQRNTYAHANMTVPSIDQANAYIDHLIDIISQSPFTTKTKKAGRVNHQR